MIIRAIRPGEGFVTLKERDVPMIHYLNEWREREGFRAVWVMADEGRIEPAPEQSCYELEREWMR